MSEEKKKEYVTDLLALAGACMAVAGAAWGALRFLGHPLPYWGIALGLMAVAGTRNLLRNR